MFPILLMQSLRVKLMHSKKWVLKSMIKVWTCLADDRWTIKILSSKPRTPDDLTKHVMTLISNQAKRIKKKTNKRLRKTQKHPNKVSVQNVIFIVAKICVFGVNRKYTLRASICKKNHLKRCYETRDRA